MVWAFHGVLYSILHTMRYPRGVGSGKSIYLMYCFKINDLRAIFVPKPIPQNKYRITHTLRQRKDRRSGRMFLQRPFTSVKTAVVFIALFANVRRQIFRVARSLRYIITWIFGGLFAPFIEVLADCFSNIAGFCCSGFSVLGSNHGCNSFAGQCGQVGAEAPGFSKGRARLRRRCHQLPAD